MDDANTTRKKIAQSKSVGEVILDKIHTAKISFFVGCLMLDWASFRKTQEIFDLASAGIQLFVILQNEQLETTRAICLDIQIISGFFLLSDCEIAVLDF